HRPGDGGRGSDPRDDPVRRDPAARGRGDPGRDRGGVRRLAGRDDRRLHHPRCERVGAVDRALRRRPDPAPRRVRDLALRRPGILHRPALDARHRRPRGRRRILRAARGDRAGAAGPRAGQLAPGRAVAARGDALTESKGSIAGLGPPRDSVARGTPRGASRTAGVIARAAVVAAVSLCAHPARAADPPPADYDPHSTAWNGMASFVGLAEGMGFEVTAVASLEWNELSANDILILIYPLQRVDPG